ncbi:MAG: rRNA maturation RNase YbeY [Gammaproteobacteria bacterium]|nr:rRNA maturation RNase YbeY [Gammaproteobacteria bacterium]
MNGPRGTTVAVDIQLATTADCPPPEQLQAWTRHALGERPGPVEVTVRVVDEAEMTTLNGTYRHREGPTNVLSFPGDTIPGTDITLLGDVVICAPVVAREAAAQGKTPAAHWAHMVVHGMLHLQGFDHLSDDEARDMEAREVAILLDMGFGDPYEQA